MSKGCEKKIRENCEVCSNRRISVEIAALGSRGKGSIGESEKASKRKGKKGPITSFIHCNRNVITSSITSSSLLANTSFFFFYKPPLQNGEKAGAAATRRM